MKNGLIRGRFEAVECWIDDIGIGWAVIPVYRNEVDGRAYFYTTLN